MSNSVSFASLEFTDDVDVKGVLVVGGLQLTTEGAKDGVDSNCSSDIQNSGLEHPFCPLVVLVQQLHSSLCRDPYAPG